MPILDMQLEEMREYKGMNPCPEDFDEFWDRSLEEMKRTDPKVEFRKADFQTDVADCYDMYFTGTKDSRIYAKLLKPKHIKGKIPAAINFHGYTGESLGWSTYLHLAASGFVVAALDCRGQAGLSEDNCKVVGNTLDGFITRGLLGNPEDMYYRNVFLDTAMLARIVMDMDEVDEDRVIAYGESQGGGLSIACAALEPRIRGALVTYPFLSDYKRVWHMDLDVDAYRDLRRFFRDRDPMHEREEEYFRKLGYVDIQHLAHRVKGEVHMYTGLLDSVVPPSTQFAMYNRLTCKKEVKVFHDYGHEFIIHIGDMVYETMMRMVR